MSSATADRGASVPLRVAAVIGMPARHSRSPAIHNAAFAAVGLNWAFTSFEVPPGGGAAALESMRTLGLAGLSVTMPLKAEVAAAADEVSGEVAALGVANCIVASADGTLRAHNTDASGFVEALRADAGVNVEGLNAVVLGAGGAARAVIWALAAGDAQRVTVVNRTPERAAAAAELAPGVAVVGSAEAVAQADLVVNATSVGMGADPHMPCDPELLTPPQVAVDLIYEPVETPWLAALRSRGVQAHNGLSMLVYQAAVAFKLWTGVEAPVEVMRQAVLTPT